MKHGINICAAYNFFNGEEHLEKSVLSIRESVDEICVVSQMRSNDGDEISEDALDLLGDLKKEKLIDEVIWTEPASGTPKEKELEKRRIGMEWARSERCNYFLTVDSDEFYRSAEFSYAKELILERKLKTTSVSTFFHVKSPIFRGLDITNVSFISKLDHFSNFSTSRYYVPFVDSSRRLKTWPSKHYHFETEEVSMYHMNFVRRNFESKFKNTSTMDKEFLSDVRKRIERYCGEDEFFFPGKGTFKMRNVENEFNTYCPYGA